MNARWTFKHLYFLCFAALVFCMFSPQTFAQCVPGLPCVGSLTPNQNPYDGNLPPNTSGQNAEKTDKNTCDADFMNVIYGRAWLEAERENILNEMLIAKPDSTLEYSCFEQANSMTAVIGGPLFNETDYWWDKKVIIDGHIGDHDPTWINVDDIPIKMYTHMCDGKTPCDKLDISLNDLVLTALKEYTDLNFFHDYIGGTAVGINNDIIGEVGGYYLCDFIYLVNLLARCNNFATYDQFFDFETLANMDPRLLPQQCQGTPITQEHIDLAKNKDAQYAAFDLVEDLFTDKMETGRCGDAIPTGVKVKILNPVFDPQGGLTPNAQTYEEHMCSNPGCTYIRGRGCQ